MNYLENILKAYRNIDYINRFEGLYNRHDDFDNRMKKIENNIAKRIFNNFGFKVEILQPGRDFEFYEQLDEIGFVFSLNIKGGAIVQYTYVYNKNEKVESPENIYFIYRYLIDNLDLELHPIVYKNEQDFKEILGELLSIYSDFKFEFMRLVNEGNNTDVV
jgi:hypothetical protein